MSFRDTSLLPEEKEEEREGEREKDINTHTNTRIPPPTHTHTPNHRPAFFVGFPDLMKRHVQNDFANCLWNASPRLATVHAAVTSRTGC